MQLNNLLAAPGFSAWLEGEALDVGQMLHSPGGKPRLAIFSIAHLNDAERMFFVTLLLSQTLGWVRAQSGTTSLRAILYMDEIFGYFPPVANPPSKAAAADPAQAGPRLRSGRGAGDTEPRRSGLQRPGEYRHLVHRTAANRTRQGACVGRTGRRIAASSGKKFDKQGMEQLLAGLGNRVFLLNNVHEDAPEVFQTRWTLSYLRGPLTRTQIKTLMEPVKREALGVRGKRVGVEPESSEATSHLSPLTSHASRPMLPPDVPQHFIPIRGSQPSGSALIYQPMLLGASQVRVSDSKAGVDVTQDVTVLAPISDGAVAVDWDRAAESGLALADLESSPLDGAQFGSVPSAASKAKSYEAWNKDFAGWLFRTQKVDLLKSPSTKEMLEAWRVRDGTSVCGCNNPVVKHGTNNRTACVKSTHRRLPPCKIGSGVQDKWSNGSKRSLDRVKCRRRFLSAPRFWVHSLGGRRSARRTSAGRQRRFAEPDVRSRNRRTWGKPKRMSRRCSNNWPTSKPSLRRRPMPSLPRPIPSTRNSKPSLSNPPKPTSP